VEWRIRYWHGWACVREQTVATASAAEITAMLQQLGSRHMERASTADPLNSDYSKVRSNFSETMLWTTGKDYHYTAEKVSRIFHDKPPGRRSPVE
jgi:hypothetical protein